jgi:tetratricopeptide (TPR) repeat protein
MLSFGGNSGGMDGIVPLMGALRAEGNEMRRGFSIALVLACCLAAGPGLARGQSKPAGDGQKPAEAPQSGAGAAGAGNAFPEDTSNVPVLPTKATAPVAGGADSGEETWQVALPSDELDPARSPDDPAPSAVNEGDSSSSSSLAGLDKVLPKADDDQPDGKRKLTVKEPEHQESASNDIDVGKYYLQTKNWKAAQSRFDSAMILDPENPEVYWGLAETERHLGKFAEARAHYMKLLDYDPEQGGAQGAEGA